MRARALHNTYGCNRDRVAVFRPPHHVQFYLVQLDGELGARFSTCRDELAMFLAGQDLEKALQGRLLSFGLAQQA